MPHNKGIDKETLLSKKPIIDTKDPNTLKHILETSPADLRKEYKEMGLSSRAINNILDTRSEKIAENARKQSMHQTPKGEKIVKQVNAKKEDLTVMREFILSQKGETLVEVFQGLDDADIKAKCNDYKMSEKDITHILDELHRRKVTQYTNPLHDPKKTSASKKLELILNPQNTDKVVDQTSTTSTLQLK